MNNFIDLKTGLEIYIPRYRTFVLADGFIGYKHWKEDNILNVRKIETKLNPIGIKTETKSRQ